MAVKLNEMEKKQTAVDWLIEQITNKPLVDIDDEWWFGVIGEAKQLEKQQIVDAVDGHPIQNRHLDGEQYYATTYGKD